MKEKIRELVENMFNGLPKTQEVVDVKLGIIENMQEKYLILLQDGKSENEAFGIVVAQFGSIEELKRELNITEEITPTDENNGMPPLSAHELATLREEYKVFTKKFSIAIGIGVVLCILAPIAFVLLEVYSDNLAIAIFLSIIAVAVFNFIIWGTKEDYYKEQLNMQKQKKYKYEYKDDENDPFVGAIYLGATAVFLLLGFIGGWWHPGWLVYLLATAIVMMYRAGKKRKM